MDGSIPSYFYSIKAMHSSKKSQKYEYSAAQKHLLYSKVGLERTRPKVWCSFFFGCLVNIQKKHPLKQFRVVTAYLVCTISKCEWPQKSYMHLLLHCRFSDLGHRRPIGWSSGLAPWTRPPYGPIFRRGSTNLNQHQCACWSKSISGMQSAQLRS